MMINSGATVNMIYESTFNLLNRDKPLALASARRKIYPYGSKVAPHIKGLMKTRIRFQTKTTTATVFAVQGNAENLLGYDTANELGIIKIKNNHITNKEQPNLESMLKDHALTCER